MRTDKKRTIEEVEYVADAVILGHLRAALVNIDYAAKDFKRHHFELKNTELAERFAWLRSLARQVMGDFVVSCNEKIQGHRLEYDRQVMSGKFRKRSRGWAKQ